MRAQDGEDGVRGATRARPATASLAHSGGPDALLHGPQRPLAQLAQALQPAAAPSLAALWPLSHLLMARTELEPCMSRLGDVQGSDEAVRFVCAGRHVDHLTLSALGTPLLESAAPLLHHTVAQLSERLGLELAPEVFVHPALGAPPHGDGRLGLAPPVALLHLPHVSDAALLAPEAARGAHHRSGWRAPRLADGSFGWRRRAVLLVAPELAAALAPLPPPPLHHQHHHQHPAYSQGEATALLACALGPMCLPGGGGWRLNLHVAQGGSVEGGNTGVGPGGMLAPADVVTAVALARAAPAALVPHLPVQLRVKWARVQAALQRVELACAAVGDRAALLCCGQLEEVLLAIHKSCAPDAGQQQQQHATAEQLVAQVHQLYPAGSALPPLVDLDLPLTDCVAGVARDRRAHALLRMAHLIEWAGSREYVLATQAGEPFGL